MLLGGLVLCSLTCERETFSTKLVCPAPCVDSACAVGIECTSQTYCPIGSTCVPTGTETAFCGSNDAPDVAPDALIEGFGVAEFPLLRDVENEGQFLFDAPPDAEAVLCGLFIAAPRFEEFRDEDPSDEKLLVAPGSAQQRMINSDSCIVRDRIFRIDDDNDTSHVAVLRLEELRPPQRSCGTTNTPFADGSEYPIVETLHLGCWALGEANVIGVSALVSLSASELPDLGEVPIKCDQGDAQTDGAYCYVDHVEGVCSDEMCVAGGDNSAGGVTSVDAGSGGAGTDSSGAAGQGDAGGAAGQSGVIERVKSCKSQPNGTLCSEEPAEPVGRCFQKGCVGQDVPVLERPLVVANCALQGVETDWLNCFPSPLGTIGTCFGAACRVRCHDITDCERTAKARSVTSPEECRHTNLPGYLGVCRTVEVAP
jgi:hypothetical protein